MITLTPKNILALPRRSLCAWTDSVTKTCSIHYNDNTFSYYMKTLDSIKAGDFDNKELEAIVLAKESRFKVRSLAAIKFRPLAVHMHQVLHRQYVQDGWTVISTYPEQTLQKTIVPNGAGWHIFLDSRTNRFLYKLIYRREKRQKDVTIEQMLQEMNKRDADVV